MSATTAAYIADMRKAIHEDPVVLIAYSQTFYMRLMFGRLVLCRWITKASHLTPPAGVAVFEFSHSDISKLTTLKQVCIYATVAPRMPDPQSIGRLFLNDLDGFVITQPHFFQSFLAGDYGIFENRIEPTTEFPEFWWDIIFNTMNVEGSSWIFSPLWIWNCVDGDSGANRVVALLTRDSDSD